MARKTVRIRNPHDDSEATVQPSAAHVWLDRGWIRVDDESEKTAENAPPPAPDHGQADQNEERS